MKCIEYGHEIVALVNLLPANDSVDEFDSYMYQTVGHQIVVSYASCMGVPLFRRRIQGSTRRHDLSYNMTPGDEVEDMFILLKEVKEQIPSITAVSSGAISKIMGRKCLFRTRAHFSSVFMEIGSVISPTTNGLYRLKLRLSLLQ